MAGYGQIKLKTIWHMLDECLPGYTKTPGKHLWIVKHGDREFLQLPLGDHGSRNSGTTTVERGIVRSLVRTFDIEECAVRELPQIRKRKKKTDDTQT